MPPAPTPCMPRHTISIGIDVDSPHSAEPTRNVQMAMMNIRLRR